MKDGVKIFLFICVIALAWGIGLCADPACATHTRALAIDYALRKLVYEGLPEHKIEPCPSCPGARRNADRRRLSRAIAEASTRYSIDPGLLGAIAFREGAFRAEVVGGLNEGSTFQIVPAQAKRLKCDLSTHAGAADCSAKMLSLGRIHCGDLEGAILFYATGRTCEPDTPRLKWMLRDRLGIARRLNAWIAEAL